MNIKLAIITYNIKLAFTHTFFKFNNYYYYNLEIINNYLDDVNLLNKNFFFLG